MTAALPLANSTAPTPRQGLTSSSPVKMALASVPWSIKSSLVSTASVRSPRGSTCLENASASLLARSALAALTAKMITLSFSMYDKIMAWMARTT